ncbi:uncharacterized protein LOC129594064 [Paramacrobiotus metropolitanus]|uniref:uncharacterized protein LOC129594064 n=1 Tax=Paramacrobiotus metropolitanus TaxID=2943436 RepID=UPI002445EB65|nr:uncharacterized protein LOC129594064 [Paramacrobiotus metropolitanus]
MARLLKDCFCCSLKTACVYIAAYTMMIALLLLIFNINDVVLAGGVLLWGRITSLVFAVLLILASVCLLRGTVRDRGDLLAVWLVVFFVYTIFSLVTFIWNVRYYYYGWFPDYIHTSVLANMIIFGVLFFIDLFCLMAVYSHRHHMGFDSLP